MNNWSLDDGLKSPATQPAKGPDPKPNWPRVGTSLLAILFAPGFAADHSPMLRG